MFEEGADHPDVAELMIDGVHPFIAREGLQEGKFSGHGYFSGDGDEYNVGIVKRRGSGSINLCQATMY